MIPMVGNVFSRALNPKTPNRKTPKIPLCVTVVMAILAVSLLGIPWFVFNTQINTTMHTLVDECMELDDKIYFVALVNAQIPIFYFVVERRPHGNLDRNCKILLDNLIINGRRVELNIRSRLYRN